MCKRGQHDVILVFEWKVEKLSDRVIMMYLVLSHDQLNPRPFLGKKNGLISLFLCLKRYCQSFISD